MVQSGLAFFSIDMAHRFLNFWVGVRQWGFRIKGVKCIERNMFLTICSNTRDSGWSEFGQTGLTVFVNGIDLIVKTHKKKFPSYHWFRAQHIYYITIAVCSYERGAEKILSLSNILKISIIQQWELLIQTYIHYKIDADNQLHNCVCGAHCLSRWRCYKYTCKITAEKNDWIAIALIALHRNVKVNHSKSI